MTSFELYLFQYDELNWSFSNLGSLGINLVFQGLRHSPRSYGGFPYSNVFNFLISTCDVLTDTGDINFCLNLNSTTSTI